jgi:hypothetical protein
MTDGQLLHHRATYPIDTAWAPPWVGDQLRQARRGASDARLAAIRARAEAAAAHRHDLPDIGARHETLAASFDAMTTAYTQREATLAAVMDDRRTWDQATGTRRHLAVAADAELRRRHPAEHHPPLRSAEPELPAAAQPAGLTLTAETDISEPSPWISELATEHEQFAQRLAQHKHQRGILRPSEPVGALDRAIAWRAGTQPLLQPPKPEIPPTGQVLERVGQHELELEAGC